MAIDEQLRGAIRRAPNAKKKPYPGASRVGRRTGRLYSVSEREEKIAKTPQKRLAQDVMQVPSS